jgi:hypothetical protein
MTPAPKRWFRWSLRTMFVVVTVLGAMIGYELNWIRDRHRALSNGEVSIIACGSMYVPHIPYPPPWHLRVLGETQVSSFGLVVEPETTDGELARLRGLFPELPVERDTADPVPPD